MRVNKIRKHIEKSFRIRQYRNLIEALCLSKYVRKVSGITVLDLENTEKGIVTKFSLLGFVFFVIWYSLYFFCTYKAHIEDQTILRYMYNTRVQRYGDDCERITSIVYVLVAMWKIPFCLSGNRTIMQIIINSDKILESLGEKVDYNKDAYSASAIAFGQLIIYLVRLFSIWLTLHNLNVDIPSERMYQVVFSDSLALIVTAYYCFFLVVLRGRFRYANKVLKEINSHTSWEYKIFVRGKMTSNVQKAGNLQDKYISEKIKTCARVYGMLYKVVMAMNEVFGLMLVMTMFVCLIYIILYMFYFMEATAGGLFHDLPKYIDFSIYVFWQAAYAVGILYVIVYFCECVMREARETSYILHEIMSGDLSPSVTSEAMQLSLQLLHQRPIFTAYGLYKLNYALFEQGARSASTYLVILLQFVTDANL
ncbi:putative gustatory receptor 28a [Anticarsia gemmatalis]|uniref:putative gustatory receptor 28a n=1 Tax=Anticarsia gemmatalis TaxID=129554 RepID=UPI003F762751